MQHRHSSIQKQGKTLDMTTDLAIVGYDLLSPTMKGVTPGLAPVLGIFSELQVGVLQVISTR